MMKKTFLLFACLTLFFSNAIATESTELTLEKSIKIALEKNHSLKMQKQKLQAARAKVGEARAAFLPKFTANATYTRLDVAPYISFKKMNEFMPSGPISFPDKITMGDDDIYGAVLSVQQPIFTGFKVLNGYKIASYGAKAEENSYQKTRAELIFDVKKSYYDVLKTDHFLKTIQESLLLLKAHINDLNRMYEVGLITKNELLKAKVQLSDIEVTKIKAENMVKIARTAFCNVIGIPLTTDISLKHEFDSNFNFQEEQISVETAVARALKNRPELRQMDCNLNIGKKSVSLAKSEYLPNIILAGNYNYKRPNREYESKFYKSWDVSLVAQFNIFDWGGTHYKIANSKHQYMQMEEGKALLKNGIILEVTQACFELEEAQKRLTATEEAIQQAEENYRVTDEKFKQNMATNTDLLDANTMLTQAKINHITALADYKVALAKFDKVIGK
jgi:outer membrane protein TolC